MTVLLRDAIKPNLLQTLEGGPAFVHCGPFANIAHGNNSILADRLALATYEIVCTEAGFGADMGAEKFFDIKCRASGLRPDAAVMVATVRALKMHGGVGRIVAGKPLDPALTSENVEAVRRGRGQPRRADRDRPLVRRAGRRGHQRVPRPTPPAEVAAIREVALGRRRARRGRGDATSPTAGAGAEDLARGRLGGGRRGRAGLPLPLPGRDAAAREDRDDRDADLRRRRRGLRCRPRRRRSSWYEEPRLRAACRSAWPRPSYSLSHDPNLKGRPTGFRVPVREVRLAAGAGFVTPLVGEMRTMPGLPSRTRPARRSTSTPTGTWSGSSSPAGPPRTRSSRLISLVSGSSASRAAYGEPGSNGSPARSRHGPSRIASSDSRSWSARIDAVRRVEHDRERRDARTRSRSWLSSVPATPAGNQCRALPAQLLHLPADRPHRVEAARAAGDLAQLQAQLGAGDHLRVERIGADDAAPAAPRATTSGVSSRSRRVEESASAAASCGPYSPRVIGRGPAGASTCSSR